MDDNRELVDVPQPPGLPLVGNLFTLDMTAANMSLFSLAKQPAYRELFSLTILGERFVFTNTAAIVDELCDEARFSKLIFGGLEILRDMAGNGLFTAYGPREDDWGVAHRVLMPVFGPLRVRAMWPQMKDLAMQLCLKWARHSQTEPFVVDAADDFTRLTLDTIGLCAMGYRFNSFYLGQEQHPFVGSMSRVLREADLRSSLPQVVQQFRFSANRRYSLDIDYMRSIGNAIVKERRQQGGEGCEEKDDLISAMLYQKDPVTGNTMTDKSIVDNMVTFLVAGHETTSGLLSFAWYYLLTNPSTLAAARAEVDATIGTAPLDVEHIAPNRLPYVDAVLREALRLQPTAPMFAVGALKDEEVIGGRYKVRKGEPLVALLHAVHTDPAVWGPDAEQFRPERFLNGGFERLPKSAWKPFGNGLRGCIGRAFAWQEAMLVMAAVLQNFDVEMADPLYELKIKEMLTIKPQDLKMRVSLREGRGDATELVSMLQQQALDISGDAKAVHKSSSEATARPGDGLQSGKPLTILFGSNSGTCEALAYRLARDAVSKGYAPPTILPMNSMAGDDKLPTHQPVLILTASYDGQPADNAQGFVQWLEALDRTSKPLAGTTFAVFGCGHRDWVSTLHRIPRLVDQLLADAGSTRLASLGTADSAVSDLFADLDAWSSDVLWPAHGLGDGSDKHSSRSGREEDKLIASLLQVDISAPRRLQAHDKLVEVRVRAERTLTAPDAIVCKKHVEIELPLGTTYSPGDHVVVLPTNPPATVRRALARLGVSGEAVVSVKGGVLGGEESLAEGHKMTAQELLGQYVELGLPATPRDLRVLSAAATSDSTRSELSRLTNSAALLFETEIRDRRVSVLDLLERFPDIELPLGTFLELLPALRLRTYSISSSPNQTPFKSSTSSPSLAAHLTFSVVDEPARSESRHRFLGVGSNYLAGLAGGDVFYAQVKPARAAFHLAGEEDKDPVVMIAAGAGLAPFRGFVQELTARKGKGVEVPEAVLFFGCRGPEDDIYREELDAAENMGVIRILRAYSRADPTHPETIVRGHVQGCLNARREELVSLWNNGAKVFVCGNTAMSADIKNLVTEVARDAALQAGEALQEDLAEWFRQFEPARYCAEVFV